MFNSSDSEWLSANIIIIFSWIFISLILISISTDLLALPAHFLNCYRSSWYWIRQGELQGLPSSYKDGQYHIDFRSGWIQPRWCLSVSVLSPHEVMLQSNLKSGLQNQSPPLEPSSCWLTQSKVLNFPGTQFPYQSNEGNNSIYILQF